MGAIPKKVYESKVGLYKGKIPRITFETKRLTNTEFLPGKKILVEYKKNKILITINENGTKQVTSRRGKQVLDLKTKEIEKSFKNIDFVKVVVDKYTIVISPLKEALERKRAKDKIKVNKRNYDIVDIFCSGGTLAKCFSDNKKFNIKAGIDFDDKKLETYQANFPNAETWSGDVANVEWERYKDAPIVIITPSCKPYTALNQAAAKHDKKNEKAKEGDNSAFGLFGISIIRPAVIILEEVPEYTNSYSYILFKNMLKKMGYYISEKVLNAQHFGSLSKRKRVCMVASIKKGFEFLPITPSLPKSIGDILELPFEKREWSSFSKFQKWSDNQTAKGRNFTMVTVDRESTSVSHPTTRYYGRQYSAVLENEHGLKSFFTPRELARIADLPEDFILPKNRNEAAFVIGDGIVYSVFSYIAKCVELHIKI